MSGGFNGFVKLYQLLRRKCFTFLASDGIYGLTLGIVLRPEHKIVAACKTGTIGAF
jgi:hypothetical protein